MERPILARIKRLGRQAFVDLIAEVYRVEGYLVEQMGDDRANAGYDLVLLRETSVLVQCRHWLVDQVGGPRVRELAGAMHKVGATGGVLVTGGFTKSARALAAGMAIQLVDGKALSRRFSSRHTVAGERGEAA